MNKIYISELVHHGVDGQQWGVRNGPPYPLDRKSARAERKQKLKEVKSRKHIKKPSKLAYFSDEELQKAIDRLNLELEYMDLVDAIDNNSKNKIVRETNVNNASSNKSKNKKPSFLVEAGKKAVSNAIIEVGNDVGAKTLNYIAQEKVNEKFGKKVVSANTGVKKEKEKENE